jgi:hypothetical protein
MNTAMSQHYAAISGDLVKSSRLSADELDQARERLRAAAAELDQWEPGTLAGGIDFFRGDAWQLLLTRPRWALRSAMYLRAVVIGARLGDTRVAIGIGRVEQVASERVSLSTGEAFALSGKGLDALGRRRCLAVNLSDATGTRSEPLAVILHLCDVLIQDWTARQAQAVQGALRNQTQVEIAESLTPKTRQPTVARALAGAGWDALEHALQFFEKQPF